MKAALIGHLPHRWLLNNRVYSLPGGEPQAHQGSGLPLCSDFMAFYATIRNTVYSVGAHCARLQGCGLRAAGRRSAPGEEGLCEWQGDKTRGVGHCYQGNFLASVGAALGPGCLSPAGQGEGRRRVAFPGQQQQSRLPGKVRASGLCGDGGRGLRFLWAAETSSCHL